MQAKPKIVAAAAAVLLAGCASGPSPADLDAQFAAMMKASFRDQGIAKADRLKQDAAQAACSSDKPPAEAQAKRLEAEAMSTIKWPSGGQYFGDFPAGEKLAESGGGMAGENKAAAPQGNGGNRRHCHQIDRKELSYGTIGPSLWNYGKLRGVKDLNDPKAAEVIQYTWGRLWNSHAFAACSNMPRFGHQGILDEGQIRNLMSLLLDPRSPVNQ